MADTERDKFMRLTGRLDAALDLVEKIEVPHDEKRIRELKAIAESALRKAMLAAWETADLATQVQHSGEQKP